MTPEKIEELAQEFDLVNYVNEGQWRGFAEAVRAQALEDAIEAVLDDPYAITFQSGGQYRTALARRIRALKAAK